KTATKTHAAGMLRAFGAEKVIMLDGGGSTQLICNTVPLIASDRDLPQTLGVTASTPPPLSASVTDQPVWPILVEGDRLEIEIILQNTGTEPWRADQDLLVSLKNPWGAEPALPLPGNVAPYEKAVFTWRTDRFQRWGVFESQWRLERAGAAFSGDPLRVNVIVLPRSLADKKAELEEQLRAWLAGEAQDIEQMVVKWIEAQLETAIQNICLPQAVLPLGLVLVLASRKKRK
ncbi:MAG TPA: hypothetical protein VJ436_08650, partial [Anaerolineales bacterium]|nr:hypothetical protein [Anaerolineales bacterium]